MVDRDREVVTCACGCSSRWGELCNVRDCPAEALELGECPACRSTLSRSTPPSCRTCSAWRARHGRWGVCSRLERVTADGSGRWCRAHSPVGPVLRQYSTGELFALRAS